MTRRISADTAAMLATVLTALGIPPLRSGEVIFRYDGTGKLAGVRFGAERAVVVDEKVATLPVAEHTDR